MAKAPKEVRDKVHFFRSFAETAEQRKAFFGLLNSPVWMANQRNEGERIKKGGENENPFLPFFFQAPGLPNES